MSNINDVPCGVLLPCFSCQWASRSPNKPTHSAPRSSRTTFKAGRVSVTRTASRPSSLTITSFVVSSPVLHPAFLSALALAFSDPLSLETKGFLGWSAVFLGAAFVFTVVGVLFLCCGICFCSCVRVPSSTYNILLAVLLILFLITTGFVGFVIV